MKVYALTLLAACSANERVYEQTIADYIQTEKYETCNELKFKTISMKTESCTVGDSIRILLKDAEEERKQAIAAEERSLRFMENQLENERKSKFVSKTLIDVFSKNIALSKQRMDSLQNNNPSDAGYYEGFDPDMLLAVRVTCKYHIGIPWGNASHEQTETFVLTPDGKKVIGKELAFN